MKRPSDQAKLLFMGLLRTVSALGAVDPKVVPWHYAAASTACSVSSPVAPPALNAAASGSSSSSLHPCPDITLRLARRTDVPSIQRCNLATLPENYNQQFYSNHLRQWPELALVAECTSSSNHNHHFNRNHHNSDGANFGAAPSNTGVSSLYSSFPSGGGGGGVGYYHPAHSTSSESNVIAYVLGKVEERPVSFEESYWSRPDESMFASPYETERLGHVTSLAVSEPFRRQGLAVALMRQLHFHLQTCYSVDAVGLHVRLSNHAAARLYENFGYAVAEIIPEYYQDGEDAYFMKKQLTDSYPVANQQRQQHHRPQQQFMPPDQPFPGRLFGSLQQRLRQRRPWETGPFDLRLPRLVGKPLLEQLPEEEQEETPELLTGTM